MNGYPWYAIANGDDLEQSDILDECSVFIPPDHISDEAMPVVEFGVESYNVIVVSQTCDLVKEREKVQQVLLCGVWFCEEIGGHLDTEKGKEDARRGNLPAFHMIAACDVPGFERDVVVVDFRTIYSLPIDHFRNKVEIAGDRIRLLPPYREHLAQAFARYFMRVGLPVDIPPFP